MARRIVEINGLTAASIRGGALSGRNVTVLGLARSGIALARFFGKAGANVTIYDGRPASELTEAIESLGSGSVRLELGPQVDPASAWADADLVATSPSINPDFPTAEPRLRDALRALVDAHRADPAGAPALVSEADLVLRLCPCPTIGVTGTKGKTTTSSLIAALLATDPDHPVILGGNIGIPLIERVTELTPQDRVVIELSELQLPTLSRGTTVAVYTNVLSDHLDRHGSLEAYRAVKRRLADLVEPGGVLILNGDDPVVMSYAEGARVQLVIYRRGEPVPAGMGLNEGWIVGRAVSSFREPPPTRVMPITELAIPGDHNVSNAMAAIAVARHFDIAPEAIRRAAAAFRGVEHRLEHVVTVDGVQFINDSQGTQPDAVIAALRSFPRPLVLIAGGRDKGVDLSGLGPVAAERADAAILIGESGPGLAEMFRANGMTRVEQAATLEAAVERADAIAREALAAGAAVAATSARSDGVAPAVATVLMSPAAASFDMFVDYAARGRAFRDAANAIAARHRSATENTQ